MTKILVTFLTLSYMLIADALPTTITTTIANVNSNGEIQLSSSVPAGMSGIVIHNYGNALSAISNATVSKGNGQASLQEYRAILHENIPNIQTLAQKGDKVVFGNFYNNVLLIAPNESTYRAITSRYAKTWVHPDAYALDFMKEESVALNKESLKKFAQLNQVGLVLIVAQNRLLILDPISQQFLGEMPTSSNQEKAMAPFYARFEQMDTSTFGFSNTNYTPYFQSIAGLK